MYIKNSIHTLLLILLLAAMPAVSSMASTVEKLDIKVILQKDGSAQIEEKWDIDVNDEDAKTEWYVAHRGLGAMRITQLEVEGYVPGHEGLQRYETLGTWNIDASRKEKTGKCGLSNNGQEICWGFGDYGQHVYIVRYVLTGLVQSYDTHDGFNHCFVDMDCDIHKAQVVISTADSINISEANTRRWAFGYEGRIEFDVDSNIVVTPNGPLDSGSRIIVMLEFDKGVFQPQVKASESWADRKQRALDGSDFKDEDLGFWGWVMVIAFILVAILIFFLMGPITTFLAYCIYLGILAAWWVFSLSPLRKYLKRRRLGVNKPNYWRDVKPEWSIIDNKMVVDELSYFWGMDDEKVIGALLLRLISHGDVSIVQQEYKNKMHDMLRIDKPLETIDKQKKGDDRLCQHLLRLLTLASGSDHVLQPNEFKTWCRQKSNYSFVKSFMDLLKPKRNKEYLEKHAAEIYGLKSFLKDFTLLNERCVNEVPLWDEYMVYAEFFGISDTVRKQMKEIWPEYSNLSLITKNLDAAQEGDIVYMFSDAIYTSTTSAIERYASRASSTNSGYSSWSSFSGGGGSSGGGGGGGR